MNYGSRERSRHEEPDLITQRTTAVGAISRIHERRLEGLPIVDQDMRAVDYLSRLQLVQFWLQKHHLEPGP